MKFLSKILDMNAQTQESKERDNVESETTKEVKKIL